MKVGCPVSEMGILGYHIPNYRALKIVLLILLRVVQMITSNLHLALHSPIMQGFDRRLIKTFFSMSQLESKISTCCEHVTHPAVNGIF